MKKSVVILLIVVALIVLITPGIIGRLAEESIGQNLELAVTENEDVVVSSLGFVRGWFTSEGQHRIELRDNTALTGPDDDPEGGRRYVNALIITTRIDHGLIPVTSMAREEGSLAPGLGSAVSTVSAEVSDGTSFDLPGTIYSEVGLTGELQSTFRLDADSLPVSGGRLLEWGDADVLVTSNPVTGAIAAKGEINGWSVATPQETVSIGRITIDSAQQPGAFGFPLGFIDLNIDSLAIESAYTAASIGLIRLESDVGESAGRVDAAARLEIENFSSQLGDGAISWHARIEGADGNGLGKFSGIFKGAKTQDEMLAAWDKFGTGFIELLAAGMEVHFDRLDVLLPQGSLSSKLNLTVHESDASAASMAAVILALDGTLELAISQGLVDWITGQYPEFATAVALGYLRQSGDLYETLVEIRSGVLTINGAPMQIPLSAF